MEILKTFFPRLILSLFIVFTVNVLILFTIPPATTFGIVIKDVLSLAIGALCFFKSLKK